MIQIILCVAGFLLMLVICIFDIGVFSKKKSLWGLVSVISALAGIGAMVWIFFTIRAGIDATLYYWAVPVILFVLNAFAGKKRDQDVEKGEIIVPLLCVALLVSIYFFIQNS